MTGRDVEVQQRPPFLTPHDYRARASLAMHPLRGKGDTYSIPPRLESAVDPGEEQKAHERLSLTGGVPRNITIFRFPEDFMYLLNRIEEFKGMLFT